MRNKAFVTQALILALQIVAIVVLIALPPAANARGVGSMPVPSRYVKNPPDVGFRYYQRIGRDEEATVWVPGLTDNMNAESKRIFYEMKAEDPKAVWDYRRKQVGGVIQYAQDHPEAECKTVVNNTATAVNLVCNHDGQQTSFPNVVATQFDHYLDDVMVTPMEEFETGRGGGSPYVANPQTGPGLSGSYQRTPSARSQNNQSAGGPASAPRRGQYGQQNSDNTAGAAYSRYISSQVAPAAGYSRRRSDSVFSSGQEEFYLLEERLEADKKSKLAPAPAARENRKPANSDNNS